MAMTEVAWWKAETSTGSYQYVLEIDEQHLEKIELALANNPDGDVVSGFWHVRLLHADEDDV